MTAEEDFGYYFLSGCLYYSGKKKDVVMVVATKESWSYGDEWNKENSFVLVCPFILYIFVTFCVDLDLVYTISLVLFKVLGTLLTRPAAWFYFWTFCFSFFLSFHPLVSCPFPWFLSYFFSVDLHVSFISPHMFPFFFLFLIYIFVLFLSFVFVFNFPSLPGLLAEIKVYCLLPTPTISNRK